VNTLPEVTILRLRQAQRITVLTGAGISAESGIPTFRDAQTGLWAQYSPQELATPEAFARNPRLVWEWYAWRRSLIAQARPNAGHRALVVLERLVPDFILITQNIDGLHQAAGSRRVIELHGNIHRVKCVGTGHMLTEWEEDNERVPPPCPHCGSLLRPDVVWFGETLPTDALEVAWHAAQNCEVFFTVGTSAAVQPAAQLPLLALEAGALVIEINPEATSVTPRVHHHIAAPAGEALPALLNKVWGETAQ